MVFFIIKNRHHKKFHFKCFSAEKIEERTLCEPCFSENMLVQAAQFCKTCDDPELLCDTCAKHHIKQKAYKHHELTYGIGDFQKRYIVVSKKL